MRRSMHGIWPFTSLISQIREGDEEGGPRVRASSRERPPSEENCQRSSSVPPQRNYLPLGREFEEDTVLRDIVWRSSAKTKVFRAGNLLLDVIQTENGVLLMRVRPRGEADDVFLFSSDFSSRFFSLRACSDLSAFHRDRLRCDRVVGEGSHMPTVVYMDKRIWLVHSKSGSLDGHLPDTAQV